MKGPKLIFKPWNSSSVITQLDHCTLTCWSSAEGENTSENDASSWVNLNNSWNVGCDLNWNCIYVRLSPKFIILWKQRSKQKMPGPTWGWRVRGRWGLKNYLLLYCADYLGDKIICTSNCRDMQFTNISNMQRYPGPKIK